MKNIPTYLKDSYAKTLDTKVVSFTASGSNCEVVLEDTVFYPEGGGQPCDQGSIEFKGGGIKVNEVKLVDGEIVHRGKLKGEISEGQDVKCEIDWNRRYKNMIVHTMGHLIEEILYEEKLSPQVLKAVKASHAKKPYVEYKKVGGDLPKNLMEIIESGVGEMINEGLDIKTEFVSKDEIENKARWIPPKLPSDKPLRVVSIGDNKGIPDGGTLLKNTSEGMPISVEVEEVKDKLVVHYKVKETAGPKKSKTAKSKKFEDIECVKANFSQDISEGKLSIAEIRTKYLGKKGIVREFLREIGKRPEEDRVSFGAQVNELKNLVEEQVSKGRSVQRKRVLGESLTEEGFDLTAPFAANTPEDERPALRSEPGSLHPITSIGEKALRIFQTMGFHVTEARTLDSDYFTFESINIPKDHPARDLWDTFWTEDDLIPIPHTSAMQNRIIRSGKPPMREVIVGKCFRNEATDASHEHTFYQVEGVYVDKGITLADLIGTLSTFMNEFYGKTVKYSIQPAYFPFVEPGFEFMVECLICGQRGCPFCGYSGWIELIPCGSVHPNVLKEGGLDPKVYSGFAWGLGYDRLVMLGAQIEDIRRIHCGDLKFLEQFK